VAELGYDKPFGRHESEGKGRIVAAMQDYTEVFNSLKLCTFIMSSALAPEIVEWVNAVTGWDMTVAELLRVGERSNNLKRLYNMRLGAPHDKDTLHERVLNEKLARGSSADYLPPLEPMLAEYYQARGWDANGMPSYDKLSDLGLADFWEGFQE
jgi:aldehyde:ferredoxin oxidoreductase